MKQSNHSTLKELSDIRMDKKMREYQTRSKTKENPSSSPAANSQLQSQAPSMKLKLVKDDAKNKASTLKEYRVDEFDLPVPYYLRVGPIKSSAKVDEALTSPSSQQRERKNE